MKCLMIIGLSLSLAGTIIVGFIAQNGIPKRGEKIKAPDGKITYFGWGLMVIGFAAQIIATVLA